MAAILADEDEVTLLDQDGRPSGSCLKRDVHTVNTQLHLAFSCYLFDGKGRVLLTRRSKAKPTFPGLWTNSFCGHPRPSCDFEDEIRLRGNYELGISIVSLSPVLPDFRYSARDQNGILENEKCPVYFAQCDDPGGVRGHPSEVSDWGWIEFEMLEKLAVGGNIFLSPWCLDQLKEFSKCAPFQI